MTGAAGLTVVILTYNSGATIGACLESLAHQDEKNFEVVIVDDDSADDTLSVVSGYSSALQLSVARNGSHSIPRGRNIGFARSPTSLVAFLDSDDRAAHDWTRVIMDTFREYPDTASISGDLIPAYRTPTAHAIALNDDAVRQVFGRKAEFWAGNCAINRVVLVDAYFDEDFRFAEDLDLVSRLRGRYCWRHVPEMKIYYYSRETFRQYAMQMYRYGFMRQYFAFTSGAYRWLDFVPLALLVGGALASAALRSWWPVLVIVPFSLLESLFVICYQRCPPQIAALTFPAWVIKNLSWGYGIGHGLVAFAVDGDTRRLLRAKRVSRI